MEELSWERVFDWYKNKYGERPNNPAELIKQVIEKENSLLPLDAVHFVEHIRKKFGQNFPLSEEKKYYRYKKYLKLLSSKQIADLYNKKFESNIHENIIIVALQKIYGYGKSRFRITLFITNDEKLDRLIINNLLGRIRQEVANKRQ